MAQADVAEPTKLGRRRDPARDEVILEAALDELVESGYEGMTIDMVAARAKAGKATVYRRWPSKADLVIDAVACMKRRNLDPDDLPDTGTLRGDLIAMIKPPTIRDSERKLALMAGIASMLVRNPELADTARAALIEPRAAINRVLFQRAIDRGEISSSVDIEQLSIIGPALAAYRTLVLHQPVDREFLIANIDQVILPAAGLGVRS
ncbi:TetR/AcrR family transcriptional regulator [Homoserinibacter sp. GY 40078]|uniref:TetR/AcrR family transcriptional regulator n=1 Tax=Homoserinibacter sp. GY 40078 TaxID=2603275 RepID=UPI0011CB2651|nr:TetR/AcrR family transcriptional regulator [Homoserinibacter sp. GY 40078]TXK18733.1 TetR/AcrR family transcriptional regulator [Homoserinibacter sp. GY 40078]